jgi:hypothetical protein
MTNRLVFWLALSCGACMAIDAGHYVAGPAFALGIALGVAFGGRLRSPQHSA